MKKLKILALILILGLVIIFIFKKNSSSNTQEVAVDEAKVIKMGTNAEFVPFEYIVPESKGIVDTYDGIDIAIAKQICDNLGYTLEIVNMSFDALVPALLSGKIDFIGSALSITDERKQAVNFSVPYYESEQCILVLAENEDIHSAEDLNGKLVGVQLGDAADFNITENFPEIKLKRYSQIMDAVLDLRLGKIDAVVCDSGIAEAIVEQTNGELKIITDPEAFGSDEYGFAFNKEDEELMNEFNAELEKMKASGELDEIIESY